MKALWKASLTLALAASVALSCASTAQTGCAPNETACDDQCYTGSFVCCHHGNGAICPTGTVCGTSAAQPCIKVADTNATVITIGPGSQANLPATCPAFTPNPASVKVGGSVRFHNASATQHTIIAFDKTPWVTVAPGQDSGAITFSKAQTELFASQSCSGVRFVNEQFYGSINVTVN